MPSRVGSLWNKHEQIDVSAIDEDAKREKYDIDLRYFPHYKNIEFYKDRTGGKPLYAENIGSSDIYIKRHDETYRLQPGKRKELVKENAETEVGYLHGGDLYPAGM